MIFYQILLAIILLGSILNCESGNGQIIGLLIWFVLSIIPILYISNNKNNLIRKDIYKINKKRIYQEKYYNEFGELP